MTSKRIIKYAFSRTFHTERKVKLLQNVCNEIKNKRTTHKFIRYSSSDIKSVNELFNEKRYNDVHHIISTSKCYYNDIKEQCYDSISQHNIWIKDYNDEIHEVLVSIKKTALWLTFFIGLNLTIPSELTLCGLGVFSIYECFLFKYYSSLSDKIQSANTAKKQIIDILKVNANNKKIPKND